MDEKNLYHNDNTENAFEQAARQQAALQEEQAQLREAQSLMKEEIISPQPILKEESVPPQPVQEPVMEAETQPSVVQPETRTPYQIPVRDSREVPQDQTQPDSSIPPQGERVQPPYHEIGRAHV